MKQILLVFVLSFLLSLAAMAFWQPTVLQRGFPLGFDIYLRWVAARAVWQGESPYSKAVTAQADLLIYGEPRHGDEIAFDFYDPAYAAVVMLPLTLLPVTSAGIAWSALSLAVLITLLIVWSWQLEPRPAPLIWGIVLFSGLLFRPAIMTIINGQYALFIVACGALAWWSIRSGGDGWAGLLLAICTIKPSIALFAPLVILLWAVRWKRSRLVIAFVVTALCLGLATLVRIGWWITDFVQRTATYTQDARFALAWTAGQIATAPGLLWLALTVGLMVLGLARLWRAPDFPFAAILAALNLNLLLTPHIIEYDLAVLLVLLLWLGAKWMAHPWGRAAWILLIWMPWLSWGLMLALGHSTAEWQQVIWQFYPSLLLLSMLFEFGHARLSSPQKLALTAGK